MDQHGQAARQLSALLSAALAAAQTTAASAAERARSRAQAATAQARAADRHAAELSAPPEQQRAAADREAERAGRAAAAVRHRQWGLAPTSRWLHDNPLSAAAAWASADVHRGDDPVAERHAQQWEAIFAKENVPLADVRANAPAAVTAGAARRTSPRSPAPATAAGEVGGELAAAGAAGSAVAAGAVDAVHALEQQQPAAGPAGQWTAYADGAPAAVLGGRGVSRPPDQVLTAARKAPDLASTAAAPTGRAAELVSQAGLER